MDLIGQRFGKLIVISFSHTGKGHKKYWNCDCDCGNSTVVGQSQLRSGKTKSCGCIRGRAYNEDIIGERFGKLEVASFFYSQEKERTYCNCVCDCGQEVIVAGSDLRGGHTKSCGCSKENQAEKVVGKTFGMLYVKNFDHRDIRGNSYYLCVCKCGKTTIVRGTELLRGTTKSCGCYVKDRSLISKEYNKDSAWNKARSTLYSMRIRCLNEDSKAFKNYGGRGITVCPRWLEKGEGVKNFIADIGLPSSFSDQIDRIDNEGNYEPGNCRWVSSTENNRNTRRNRFITFQGRTQCASAWIEELNICDTTFFSRLSRGWTEEEALTIPAGGRRKNV